MKIRPRTVIGALAIAGLVFISRLFGCSGGGMFGVGGGGSGPGLLSSRPDPSKEKAVSSSEKPATDQTVALENRLGIQVTPDAVLVNVYVVEDRLELEGKSVTAKELQGALAALKAKYPNRKVRVIAQTLDTTRMKGLHDLKAAVQGAAEYVGPVETSN